MLLSTKRVPIKTPQRSSKRIQIQIRASAAADEPYKYSDHVVYNEAFSRNVRNLERIWKLSSIDHRQLKPVLLDGAWLADCIESRLGKRYECRVKVVNTRPELLIGPYVYEGGDYQGYSLRMTGYLSLLIELGVETDDIKQKIGQLVPDCATRWTVFF